MTNDNQRTMLEVIAPSVEEALAKGLTELGLEKDAVDIEILDEGTRGLFGLLARQARIRLTLKDAPAAEPTPTAALTEPTPKEPNPKPTPAEPIEETSELQLARQTVAELLELMQIKANVTSFYGEPDERQAKPPVWVEITGKDLTILIGRKAETLTALQYIASLIISKKLGHTFNLTIDVEKFRERRHNQLRQIARRMADQAVKTGKRQILEPMPSSDRRIIHIELRNNPDVQTESVGEEPYRKVTITPVK